MSFFMKKILILYGSYGGGHYSAAKSIKKYLDDNYNVETKIEDCIEYVSKTLNKLTTGAYKWMAKKAPGLWGRIYANSQKGFFSYISIKANKMMAPKLQKLIEKEKPDVVVSTHPFSSQMINYLRKQGKVSCELVTILTDFAPHDQWLIGHEFTKSFFVANNNMKNYLINYGVDENKIFVTGIPLSDKFTKTFDKNGIYKEFNLDASKPVILFFGGGEFGLGKKRTLEILDALIRNLPTYQIVAISGKNPKMNKKFKEVVEHSNSQNRVVVLDYTDKVAELMSISSLVVTKPGGLTTSESLASNLPILVINPIPGQEEDNAEFLEKNNVGVWLKKKDDPSLVIKELFEKPEKLEEMRSNTSLLAKKYSTKNICDIIMK